MFRNFTLAPPKPKRNESPGRYQVGYLWGLGKHVDLIGDEQGWHWRASAGKALAYWSLWYGDREVGMTMYPTNETRDWPDMLFQMVLGLKGIAECPLDDDEIDEIRQHAIETAQGMRGFPGNRESRGPKCPHLKGSIEADIWNYAYKCEYARLHGSDFQRR